MSTGTGITWKELYRFLTTTAGCTEVSWTPGTHVRLRTPSGREFGTCKPEKPGYVSPAHFAEVSRVFDKSMRHMEVWMGRKPKPGKPPTSRQRGTGKPKPAPKVVKLDPVIDLAQRIQSRATAIARSGPVRTNCRHNNHRDLQALADRLDAWFHELDGKVS